MPAFNRLTTTAFELQELLSKGVLTSVDALNVYLEQIGTHNGWLKADIAQPPRHRLFERAELLDSERREGKVRGPLHGIPILVKVRFRVAEGQQTREHYQDNIDTPSLDVGTTAGCISLVGAKARQDAEVVRRVKALTPTFNASTKVLQLLKAGVIIIGKANLSVGLRYTLGIQTLTCTRNSAFGSKPIALKLGVLIDMRYRGTGCHVAGRHWADKPNRPMFGVD
jgi:amidase